MAATLAGCRAADGDTLVFDPQSESLSGVWYYQITNAYDAVFTDCTDEATVLEGVPFNEGVLVAPVCRLPNSFEAVQDGAAVEFLPATGQCGGVSATVGGVSDLLENELAGEQEFLSDDGVQATHTFRGHVNGATLQMIESRRAFDGAFRGACNLTPPLAATVTIR